MSALVGRAFASAFVPNELRASGAGWYRTTVGLLQLVASVVSGLLWDTVGHAAVFFQRRNLRGDRCRCPVCASAMSSGPIFLRSLPTKTSSALESGSDSAP